MLGWYSESTHTSRIDYHETFASMAKMNNIRILISLANNLNWILRQFDIKKCFLHRDLDEEVYMEIPPGFIDRFGRKVCWLKRSLYSLKQSPRALFDKFTKVMMRFGYKQSQRDHALFY